MGVQVCLPMMTVCGATPHYHSDILKGNIIARGRFRLLFMSNKEVFISLSGSVGILMKHFL